MDLPFEAQTLLLLGVAVLLAGLSKGFSAFGAALVFMPLAGVVVGPLMAAPIFIVIDCFATLPLVRLNWHKADRPAVARIGISALMGLPLGICMLMLVDQTLIRWAISSVCLASVSLLIFGLRFSAKPTGLATAVTGAVSGIFQGVAQMSGPPVLLLWIAEGHTKEAIRANALLYFAGLTFASLILFLAMGILTWTTLTYSLLLLPVYGCGLMIGSRLFKRTNERYFRVISFSLIVGAAIAGLPVLDVLLRA